MTKCSRCGIEIDNSFELCPNCGNDLSKIEEKPQTESGKDNVCSQCGLELSEDSDFCPNCGNKMNVIQTDTCYECGSQIGENDLICSMCGSKINYPQLCSNCGKPLDDDSDFCPECGQSISSGKHEVVPIIEENLENVAQGTLSILDRIVLFFKQLFDGNS